MNAVGSRKSLPPKPAPKPKPVPLKKLLNSPSRIGPENGKRQKETKYVQNVLPNNPAFDQENTLKLQPHYTYPLQLVALKLYEQSISTLHDMNFFLKHKSQFNVDELSFEEGDILYVFDQSNPEWWKARCKNKSGLIPSNYVENQVEEVKEPLHDAARRGNLTFLQECLNQGVSSTGLDSMGNTPLFWASQTNHIDCVKYLLKHSTKAINAQNHFGDTPLHTAAAKNHYDIIETLLQHGASPDIVNNNGDTPEKLASNLKVKNLLQKHKLNSYSKITSTFNPEEYEDEDSD